MKSDMGDRLAVKLLIKKAIEHHLYGKFDESQATEIEAIIDLQNTLTQHAAESFSYRGKRYIKEGWKVHPKHIRLLHEDLTERMDAWLAKQAEVDEYERPLVMGYVQQVLNTARSPQDYLKLLPSKLLEPIKGSIDCYLTDVGHVSLDDAESFMGAHSVAYDLLKVRLMTNLLGIL